MECWPALIEERQQREGWGTAVIPRLSQDIRNDLPEVKGFSERNIGRMIAFYREYRDLGISILPQAVAKSESDEKRSGRSSRTTPAR